MTRYSKTPSGHYMIQGTKFEQLVGSRAQVMHGTAYKTSGGLKKCDLIQNKSGRIVSKSKHVTASREKRLIRAGYGTQKGKFGAVRLSGTRKRKGKSKRGGSAHYKSGYSSGMNSMPANYPQVDTHSYGTFPHHMGGYSSGSNMNPGPVGENSASGTETYSFRGSPVHLGGSRRGGSRRGGSRR